MELYIGQDYHINRTVLFIYFCKIQKKISFIIICTTKNDINVKVNNITKKYM